MEKIKQVPDSEVQKILYLEAEREMLAIIACEEVIKSEEDGSDQKEPQNGVDPDPVTETKHGKPEVSQREETVKSIYGPFLLLAAPEG